MTEQATESKQETKIEVIPAKQLPSASSSKQIKAYGGRPDPIGKTVDTMFDDLHQLTMKTDLEGDQPTTFGNLISYMEAYEVDIRAKNIVYNRMRTLVSKKRGGRDDLKTALETAGKAFDAQNRQYEVKI